MYKFILAISLVTFTAVASASTMTCSITADDTFISKASMELDESGTGELDAGQYDDLTFGASANNGELEALWASWLTQKSNKSTTSSQLVIESAHGEIVTLECGIE